MRNWLFVWIGLLSLGVYGREFFITKDQSDLVFDGRYLTELNNKGKEFLICVDYEAEGTVFPENYGNKFPLIKCGGSPMTENNMFWYAIHGIWGDDNRVSIRFKSQFQLWPEYNDTNPVGNFFWGWHHPSNEDSNLRIIQTHGITNYGEKRPDIDTLLLAGHGSIHIRGVKDGTKIHVRVKGEQETGITLNEVLETVYDQSRNELKPTESAVSSQETATELYHEPNTILPEKKATGELLFEEVTSSPSEWSVVDSEPAVRKQNDEEPLFLIRVPDFEDGVQSRPTMNIPFVEPVYDRSSEEVRRAQQFIKFGNEISEENTATAASTTAQTATELSKDAVDDTNSIEFKRLYDPLVDVQDSRREYNFQLLYTVLIGTAFGFFCFFVLIVLFRCYAWDKTDKVNSYSPQTQQQNVVYTIGGMGAALPIKVTTQ